MWRDKEIRDREVIVGCPDPFKDKVKCETCRCWLDKGDAQEVRGLLFGALYYYCIVHAKPYSEILLKWLPSETTRYFGKIEMTVDGEPIGYQKIKENKNDKK